MRLGVVLCFLLCLKNGDTSDSLLTKNYPITTLVNAKWHQTPLYCEIAEYLADEGSLFLWDFINGITKLETPLNEYATASKQYANAMNIARKIITPMQLPVLKLVVSMHSLTPRIQTHFQIAKDALATTECRSTNFVEIGSSIFCDMEQLRGYLHSFKAGSEDDSVETYDFDHIYPGSNNHKFTVILYGDIGSKEFAHYHNYLVDLIRNRPIRYIVRHYINTTLNRQVRLSGYGVELHLKSTEYKSSDDVQKVHEHANITNEVLEMEVHGFDLKVLKARYPSYAHSLNQLRKSLLQSTDDIVQLKAWEFQDLGLQATAAIADIQSEESLQILQFTAHNFPMQVRNLLQHKVTDDLRNEVKHNIEIFEMVRNIVAPDGALFINGLFFDADTIEMGALMETLREEMRFLENVHASNISDRLTSTLIALDLSKLNNNEFAIDIRDPSIEWLNDIENDMQYERWPSSVVVLLRPTFPGMLRNVRLNIFNVVLIIDPVTNEARPIMKLIERFIPQMVPIRFGVVFDERNATPKTSDDYRSIICALNYIKQTSDLNALVFLTNIYSMVDENQNITQKHVRKLLKSFYKNLSEKDINNILSEESEYYHGRELAKEFIERVGFPTSPQILINGIPLPDSVFKSENDFEEALYSEILQQTSNLQIAIYRGLLTDSQDVVDYLMTQPHVMQRLNQRILGSENHKYMDLTGRPHNDLRNVQELQNLSERDMTATLMQNIKYFTGQDSAENVGNLKLSFTTLWIFGDLEQKACRVLLQNALQFTKTTPGVRVAFIPNVEGSQVGSKYNLNRLAWAATQTMNGDEATEIILKLLQQRSDNGDNALDGAEIEIPGAIKDFLSDTDLHMKMLRVYSQRVIGLNASEKLIVSNGRMLGPLRSEEYFTIDDFAVIDRINTLVYGEKLRKVLHEHTSEESDLHLTSDTLLKLITLVIQRSSKTRFKIPETLQSKHSVVKLPPKQSNLPYFNVTAIIDPASRAAQKLAPILILLRSIINCHMYVYLTPVAQHSDMPIKNFYRYVIEPEVYFESNGEMSDGPIAKFTGVPLNPLLTQNLHIPDNWMVEAVRSVYDLDNIKLSEIGGSVHSEFELEHLLLEGHCFDASIGAPPRGLQITLGTESNPTMVDTIVMANLGYFQLKSNPGIWQLRLREGKSSSIYEIVHTEGPNTFQKNSTIKIILSSLRSHVIKLRVAKKPDMINADLLSDNEKPSTGLWNTITNSFGGSSSSDDDEDKEVINIFSVASGHLYERLLRIMMVSLLKHTNSKVKFWFLKNYLSPQFTDILPHMAREYNFQYELVQYKWPRWLNQQTEKQRTIWGYKILFLDVLFPLSIKKIIFVDADAIVRTDIKELWDMDLGNAPYAYTPFCHSRKAMEGFRFWKQGYWRNHLMGRRYHISALYVVDLKRFRIIAAGDRLRGQYQALSQDPNSLANLDQDLPNNMIHQVPIKSLPIEWLWCETWCSDSGLKTAKVIDLCNNPLTKEAKLTAAQRIVPEWKDYDREIKALINRIEEHESSEHNLPPNEEEDVSQKSSVERDEL